MINCNNYKKIKLNTNFDRISCNFRLLIIICAWWHASKEWWKGKWIFWNHPAQEMKNHKSLISRGLTNLLKKKRVFSILLFTSSCTYNLKAQTDLFFCCFTLEESTKLAFFFHWFHCCQVKKALCLNFEWKKKQNCADNRDQDFSNT